MATIKELKNKFREVTQEISDKYYELVKKIQGDSIRLSNYTNWQDRDLCVSVISSYDGSYLNKLVKAIKRDGDLVVYDENGNLSECAIDHIPESEWTLVLHILERALDKPKGVLTTRDIMNSEFFDKDFFEDNDLDYKDGIDLLTEKQVNQYIEDFIDIEKYSLPGQIAIDWTTTYERYKHDFIQVNYNGQKYYIID